MRRIEGPYRVYVGLVPTGYLNPEALAAPIRDGIVFCGAAQKLEALNHTANNRILLVPDVSTADSKHGRYAYTNPEVLRATLTHATAFARSSKVTIAANSATSEPMQRLFRRADGGLDAFKGRGYGEFEHLFAGKVTTSAMDEAQLHRYQLSKDGVLSGAERQSVADGEPNMLNRHANEIVASHHFSHSGFAIYCPKLKTNLLRQGLGGAIDLGARAIFSVKGAPIREHNVFSDHLACDMLEVCNPDLIVTDGIVAAVGGSRFTQRGHELGVILVSNNALAHDWIMAQILNLDASKILSLKIAAERGWGPAHANQIELGGAGLEGIRQLSQKSRFWDLGILPVQEFSDKFDRENPGHRFPLEINAGVPYEWAGPHGMLLDWLYMTYDVPQFRPFMARWPKASVCVGRMTAYPLHYTTYLVGSAAIESVDRITSSSRRLLKIRGIELRSAQLKNGSWHLLVKIPSERLHYEHRALLLAFTLGSVARMTWHLLQPAKTIGRWFARLLSTWNAHKNRRAGTPIVLTSRMASNRWWTLNPLVSRETSSPRPANQRPPEPRSFR